MRKINGLKDFEQFATDIAVNTEKYCYCEFGLSQNGDNTDGIFYAQHNGAHPYDQTFGDKWTQCKASPAVFFAGLCGNYATPFYICDTGANYSWL